MKCWMALFGLLWLLRVRQSIYGCSRCERAQRKLILQQMLRAPPPPPSQRPPDPDNPTHEETLLDVVELQSLTRNIAVQTDFDDGPEDLDKIEVLGDEDCINTSSCSIECEREIKAIFAKNVRRNVAHLQLQADSGIKEASWESLEVTLERNAHGLGIFIASSGKEGGDITITRITENGAAKDDGRLRIGDVLERVNDISVRGGPHSFAVNTLQRAGKYVKLQVRRARRCLVVPLYRGASGLGLGIAGGADNTVGGIFVSHIYRGGAAHIDGRISIGDKILAVRDQNGKETSLIEATHSEAVAALRNAGDRVTLVLLPAAFIAPLNRPQLLRSTRSMATSCSTLHEVLNEETDEIPKFVRLVKLVRSGSRLGMDIVGGVGNDAKHGSDDDTCGVFVSNVLADGSAQGLLYKGDRILSVDGTDLTRATHREAAAALKFSGDTITIAAQYQPEHFERIRAKIRALNASIPRSPHVRPRTPVIQVHAPAEPDDLYQR